MLFMEGDYTTRSTPYSHTGPARDPGEESISSTPISYERDEKNSNLYHVSQKVTIDGKTFTISRTFTEEFINNNNQEKMQELMKETQTRMLRLAEAYNLGSKGAHALELENGKLTRYDAAGKKRENKVDILRSLEGRAQVIKEKADKHFTDIPDSKPEEKQEQLVKQQKFLEKYQSTNFLYQQVKHTGSVQTLGEPKEPPREHIERDHKRKVEDSRDKESIEMMDEEETSSPIIDHNSQPPLPPPPDKKE
jgi:hypothetical protein